VRSSTPVPLRQFLTRHEVVTACERGWSTLQNGELLDAAEQDGFEVLVTTDTNLQYQQNLTSRRIAIVVLSTPSWPRIQRSLSQVVHAVEGSAKGAFTEVGIP
jgi:hypothetical protein